MSQIKRQMDANGVRPGAQPGAAPRGHAIPIDAIVDGLAAQILPLCLHLLPAGVREFPEYRVGSLAGEAGRSLAVHLRGARAGVWGDFSTGETGDALDLVAQVLFRGDKGQALKWARGWLGLDGTDPAALRQTRRAVEAKRDEDAGERPRNNRKIAMRLWLESQETLRGTPVDLYLRGRGIDLALLGLQPRALRYHPALWHKETDRRHPAMTAAIVGPDGATVACHRTWLQGDGAGGFEKLKVKDEKMVLGGYAGGSIRLWRGASRRPLAQAPAGDTVVVTEGIEDALTVALATPQYRVLAAVSLSNMGSLVLPPQIGQVIVCADNDWNNAQADRGLDRVIAHFGKNHTVRLARSPVGKDMNDLLRGGAANGMGEA